MSSTLDEILDGIDRDEGDYDKGWWETSTGAEFGARKKQEIKTFILSEAQRAKADLLENLINDDVLVYWNDDRDTDGHIFVSDLEECLSKITGVRE